MNRRQLRSLRIVTALLVLLACRPADSADSLTILCYNIHYGQGTDGVYDLERLARVIKQHDPDLVALQEVDVRVERSGRTHQARTLGELTGMSVRYGPTQHYQGGLYGNAILSKLPILDVLIEPLPYTESTPELTTYPRGAIAVTVRTAGGQRLRLVSTHFQHNLADDRVAQAKRINELFAEDEMVTILAGDMNAVPGSEPIKILREKWVQAGGDDVPTAPSGEPRVKIDYIFYRPASRFSLHSTAVIDEPLASDHRPVLAVLELN